MANGTAECKFLVTEQHGNRIHVVYHGDSIEEATIASIARRWRKAPGVVRPVRKLWQLIGKHKAE